MYRCEVHSVVLEFPGVHLGLLQSVERHKPVSWGEPLLFPLVLPAPLRAGFQRVPAAGLCQDISGVLTTYLATPSPGAPLGGVNPRLKQHSPTGSSDIILGIF